jgi:O-antigen/teichoic acid export membrane protein
LPADSAETERANGRLSIARRIRRNFGIVFGGNVAVAALGMITLALNARALGVAGIGVLALIMTIATTIDRVFAFQNWVPLIKLGSEALQARDSRRLSQLTIVSLLFDAFAAIAASLSAMLLVLLAGEKLGIPSNHIGPAAIYMAVLISGVSDTPIGLLRLYDRFATITSIQLSSAATGCALAACLFATGAPLTAYIFGYAILAGLSNVAMLAFGLRIAIQSGVFIHLRGITDLWRGAGRDFWSFSWVMSLSGTIYVVRENAPVLVLGPLLGPAAVGLYHVAARIAGVLSMLMTAANHAFYPEAARLAATRRYPELTWFAIRAGSFCGAIGIAALVGAFALGDWLLLLVGGSAYLAAYPPLWLLIVAYCFALAGVGLRGATLVTAGPMALLAASLAPFAAFAVLLMFLVNRFGIAGAAGAQIVFDTLALAVVASQYAIWSRQNPGQTPQRFA